MCVDCGVSIRKGCQCGAIGSSPLATGPSVSTRSATTTSPGGRLPGRESRSDVPRGDQAAVERPIKEIVCQRTIRVDTGSEFTSRDLDPWAHANDVTLDFSRPDKPSDNGCIEAFTGKLRVDCLNAHWFMSRADAREKLED